MATAAGNGPDIDNGMSDSLTQESDEMQEMYCEHCKKELGTIEKVDGFCKNCLDYLCSTCVRYHTKYQPDHTIQDRVSMPQDFCFQKCQDYSGELIKFYCKSCEQKACSDCKTYNHLECSIEHLPSLVGSIDLRSEISTMVKAIDNNLTIITDSRSEISSKRFEVQELSQNAISLIQNHKVKLQNSIEEFYKIRVFQLKLKHESQMESFEKRREEVLAKLDKEKEVLINSQQVETKKLRDDKIISNEQIAEQEKDLIIQCTKTKHGDETALDTLSSEADKITATLETVKQNISTNMQRNQSCEVFLALKEAENQIENMQTDIEEVNQCGEIICYGFQSRDEKISQLNSTINYGSLEDKSKIKRKISKLHYFTANHITDKKLSNITGLCKISDTHIIAADNANVSIKMIDIERKLVSEVIKLEDGPFEITLVENNKEVAVTVPDAKKIQILSVSKDNKLSIHSQITLQYKCYGIAFIKPNLIVGCPREIKVISLNGTIVHTFDDFVGIPDHLTFHPNRKELYVTGKKLRDGFVVKITKDGRVIMKENITKLCLQFGSLAIDKAGTIYNFFHFDNWYALKQFSADLKTQHNHMKSLHILDEEPLGLFYCNTENQLYVGTNKGSNIVYKIE